MQSEKLTVGQSMRRTRKSAGLTILELSRASGVSRYSISDYERDIVAPGFFNLLSLADALGVSIDSYIGREVTGAAPPGFVLVSRSKLGKMELLVHQMEGLLSHG